MTEKQRYIRERYLCKCVLFGVLVFLVALVLVLGMKKIQALYDMEQGAGTTKYIGEFLMPALGIIALVVPAFVTYFKVIRGKVPEIKNIHIAITLREDKRNVEHLILFCTEKEKINSESNSRDIITVDEIPILQVPFLYDLKLYAESECVIPYYEFQKLELSYLNKSQINLPYSAAEYTVYQGKTEYREHIYRKSKPKKRDRTYYEVFENGDGFCIPIQLAVDISQKRESDIFNAGLEQVALKMTLYVFNEKGCGKKRTIHCSLTQKKNKNGEIFLATTGWESGGDNE